MTALTLVTVDAAGDQLAPDAAASYLRMIATGCPAGITSAWRSAEEQERLIALHAADPVHYAYAAPVGVSGHPLGTRLDLPEPARTWVRQYGIEYGWWWGENTDEPWHFTYVPALDQHAPNALTLTIVKELIYVAKSVVSDFIGLIRCKTGAVVAIHKATGKAKPVTSAAFGTLGNAGLLEDLYLDDGAGNNLDHMDEGPFYALVDVLSD